MSLRLEGLEVEATVIPAQKDLLLMSVKFSYTNYRLISFPEKLNPSFSCSPSACAVACLFKPVPVCKVELVLPVEAMRLFLVPVFLVVLGWSAFNSHIMSRSVRLDV